MSLDRTEDRPLKTEAEYKSALATIERLMDAVEGSEEAESLDYWATLVDMYENEHYPLSSGI